MQERPNADLLNSELTGSLEKDRATLETVLYAPQNRDIVFRSFQSAGVCLCLIFTEGMASGTQIGELILRASCARPQPDPPPDGKDRMQYWVENVFNVSQVEIESRVGELVKQLLSGMTIVLCEGAAEGAVLETRGFEKRNVNRTNNESVVRGSQEGFVENLRTNLTLMRRYVQSPDMITEMLGVGTKVQTRVAILHMEGVAERAVLEEVRRRVKTIKRSRLLGLGELQQCIEDCPFAIFPQMLMTERPDRAASCLLDGQIVVLMDNSPYALIAPITIFHLLHASDDTFERWQYGSFIRLIRYLGAVLSILLPGVYVAITLYHPHLIPMSLVTAIAESRVNVPFTVLTEVLIMEFSFQLINEAGTRIPSQIGSAIGIVGALILGQAAVSASIISPLIIIITALTGLGNFTIPSYATALGSILYRLLIVFAGAAFGLYGIFLVLFAMACQLCGMRSFGVPYFAPVAPHRPHNPDLLLRLPVWLQTRLLFIARRGSWIRSEGEKK